jgi:hypothetical protein
VFSVKSGNSCPCTLDRKRHRLPFTPHLTIRYITTTTGHCIQSPSAWSSSASSQMVFETYRTVQSHPSKYRTTPFTSIDKVSLVQREHGEEHAFHIMSGATDDDLCKQFLLSSRTTDLIWLSSMTSCMLAGLGDT